MQVKSSITKNIFIGTFILIILVLTQVITQYLVMDREHQKLLKLNSKRNEYVELVRAKYYHRSWMNRLENIFISGKDPEIELDYSRCKLGQWISSLEEDQFYNQYLEKMQQSHIEIHDLARNVIELAAGGQQDEAIEVFEKLLQESAILEGYIEEIETRLNRDSQLLKSQFTRVKKTSKLLVILLIFLVILGVVFFTIFLNRKIINPIIEISNASREVREGNLAVHVPERNNDEIGLLARNFNEMLEPLKFDKLANNILELLISDYNQQEIFENLREQFRAVEGISSLAIYYNEESAGMLILRSSFNLPGVLKSKYQYGEGFVGEVANSGQTISMTGKQRRYILGIPIKYNETLLGVVVFGTDYSFSQRKIQFLNQLTSQISIGLNNIDQFESIKKLNRRLQQANRIKTEFLATMSHELRTPLNSIIGFSELLNSGSSGALTEKQLKYTQNIYQSGQHLLALINDILDLAKIDTGQDNWRISRFKINELLKYSLIMVKPLARKKNISLQENMDNNLSEMEGDERKIKQIVHNLLVNAIKFTPEGGKVGLDLYQKDNYIYLEVWDTGIGIPEEKQNMIFEPFIQLDSDLNRKYEGTGLGLDLVKKNVEMGNGEITVKSKPGIGSRFIVKFPVL